MNKIIIAVFALSLCACESEAVRDTITSQEKSIADYVSKFDNVDTVRLVVNNNSYRLVFKEGVGHEAEFGNNVEFFYIGYVFSSGKGVAFDTNMDTLGFMPQRDSGNGKLGQGNFISGLDKGLTGMKVGEKAQIIFSASEGFGNVAVGNISPLSAILFEVEMNKITK